MNPIALIQPEREYSDSVESNYSSELNHARSLENYADQTFVIDMLRANGIRTRYLKFVRSRRPRVPIYRVYVYDLRILAVYKYERRAYRRIKYISKKLRVVRAMAVRVAYTLGFHFAQVEIGLIGKETAFPIDINPSPKLTPRMQGAVERAIFARQDRITTLLEEERTVVLGADPEFIMRRQNGGIIYASNYFPYLGPVGSDEQGSHLRRGHRPIAEIRPGPTESPDVLVRRIRYLLKRAMRRSPQRGVRWHAGSAPVRSYPIGGHIHLSRISLTTEIIRAFDNYLALPVVMIEDPRRARMRRPKYGHLGEFRWGRHGGFEYRTPSSWIVSPDISLAILHLARLIALNYEYLPKDIFVSPEICRMFYNADQDNLRRHFHNAWRDIIALPQYNQIEEEIAPLYDLIKEEKTWVEMDDIRVNWGLIKVRRRLRRRR